ncbi:2-hydroxyacid dehydrogenase [Acidipropionibacterium virtanenii]|uniref:Glycerate dehydrogenase n=1 Tax=Acidipropionibacterium virtanenii TaxID=2057246 RepID=A0A344UQX9_9ACTN|nr:2-hydroxyacid dehydrogenase [Acidipropionibacterium virtanenii]AXE37677.1 Glycerate dehydrogenase [Acidipropionibacterium virtanenii]
MALDVLLATDHFETTRVLERALLAELPDARISAISSDWPITPMADIEEVHEAAGDVDALIAALEGKQVCFSHAFPVTERVLDACPHLRQVTICRGGPVNVNLEAATRHGVAVTFAPGRNATSTAEHTVAMIMAAVRQIPAHDELMRSGAWEGDAYRYDRVAMEIRGNDVGVIGLGAVGSRVAAIMAAMGARVHVFDPWADPSRLGPGMELVDTMEELLVASRIVTIHARVTAENHHMIAAPQIAAMPEGSVLVNCARGSLLDYEAACDALESGHLYGAAFDCLPSEPLPEGSRLLTAPRLVLTPHIGGASKQAAELAASIGAADIAAFARGERPVHLANPEVLDS